jgi:hypothetical protein
MANEEPRFRYGVEYPIRELEHEDARDFILNRRVHVYSSNCTCPGNNIKINAYGKFTECRIDEYGEYFYLFVEETGLGQKELTSRSNFIKFVVPDPEVGIDEVITPLMPE